MTDLSTFHSVTTFKYISLKQPSTWMNFMAPFKCICRWIKIVLEMAASLTYILGMCPLWNFTLYIKIIYLSHSNTLNSATSWQIAMVSFIQRREEVVHLGALFLFFSQAWNKFCLFIVNSAKSKIKKKIQSQNIMSSLVFRGYLTWYIVVLVRIGLIHTLVWPSFHFTEKWVIAICYT